MRRLIVTVLGALLGAGVMMGIGTHSVSAHGERAQEGFVRMETATWWDVKWSRDTVSQNQPMTISGTVKLLETWPNNMSNGNPDVCYLTVVEPGARFVLVDRRVNGQETPQSMFCHKGGVYNFAMTLRARDPGYWHVHPAIAVRESGTLIGPGKYITLNATPAGFSFPVATLNGGTVDLESYGLWLVIGFSAITLVLGMWWMIYWTVPKPTVTRLAVSNRLPLNQDGGEAVDLITRKDHRHMNLIGAVTILLLVAGFIWQASAYPGKMPQQVDWVTPPTAPAPAQLASASASNAIYNPSTNEVSIQTSVTNTSDHPVQVAAFRTASLSFVNFVARPAAAGEDEMKVSPADPIAPGETRNVTIVIPGQILQTEELLPLGTAQLLITGVLEIADSTGTRNFDTIQSSLNPTRTAMRPQASGIRPA
jgi:methane/ammonia monooxygenase subunit B